MSTIVTITMTEGSSRSVHQNPPGGAAQIVPWKSRYKSEANFGSFRKVRLTGYHSKTNARKIPVRCNPDQYDVVVHDVPIFEPLRRVVFKLWLFFAFRAFSRPLIVKSRDCHLCG